MLTALFVPESRAAHARRLDPVGQVLVIVGLASLTYAIIEGDRRRLDLAGDPRLFAISLLSLGTLVLYELRRPSRCSRSASSRSAPFSGASVIAVCAFALLGGFLFLNTLYLQDVRGLSPLARRALPAADGRR